MEIIINSLVYIDNVKSLSNRGSTGGIVIEMASPALTDEVEHKFKMFKMGFSRLDVNILAINHYPFIIFSR